MKLYIYHNTITFDRDIMEQHILGKLSETNEFPNIEEVEQEYKENVQEEECERLNDWLEDYTLIEIERIEYYLKSRGFTYYSIKESGRTTYIKYRKDDMEAQLVIDYDMAFTICDSETNLEYWEFSITTINVNKLDKYLSLNNEFKEME